MPEPKPIAKSFSAVLTRTGDKLNWVMIRIPFNSVKVWGTRGHLRVKGEINGFAFRSSVFPTGDGHHMMLVNKQMQKGGKVQPGMEARFRMEPDLEKRDVKVPPELDRMLRTSKPLRKFYESLTPYFRNYIANSVASAKQPETRIRRAEHVAEQMMETLEAEIELPPLLRQIFARNPEAAAGWRRMSALHRRQHLLGIFHYRTYDARLRRIEKAMAEMASSVRET
jgi:uncharacterized protein YdeI (YjbR/CyaY-like superfamily)